MRHNRANLFKRMALLFLLVALLSHTVVGAAFTYAEGELVQLVLTATDADGDPLTFEYSSPLNESGEWQTGFDDAGTYNVTITAFDGKDRTKQTVTLVIANVNQPPVIKAEDLEVEEGDMVVLDAEISDPDGDKVTVTYSAPLNESGEWQTGFDDAGENVVTVAATDGKKSTITEITITVTDKNQAPQLKSATPSERHLTINENEALSFSVDAVDGDGDDIIYGWSVDGEDAGDGSTFTYTIDFDSAGEHEVSVELSDGEDSSLESWTVVVKNVNRAPSISDLESITVQENESFTLDLPSQDIDGDDISYTIDEPVGNDGKWTPGFDDAGEHTIHIVASDSELTDEITILVTVTDVDRAPEFSTLSDISVNEGEELSLSLDAQDPDDSPVTFTVDGLPNVSVSDGTLFWAPDYDAVSLPKNIFGQLIQQLRLDWAVFSSQNDFPVTITACSNELCTIQRFKIIVKDVNRLPVLANISVPSALEGERIVLSPVAADQDGDAVSFGYSAPFNRRGTWKPGFSDAGEHTVTLSLSDGKDTVTYNVSVLVEDVNRQPQFGRVVGKTVHENETLRLVVAASDPDGDNLSLVAEGMPSGASFNKGIFTWMPGFDTVNASDGKREFLLTFSLSELSPHLKNVEADDSTENESEGNGNFTILKKTVVVTVKNKNRLPIITAISPDVPPGKGLVTLVGKPEVFRVEAVDPDGDALHYTWKFGFLDSVSGHAAVQRRFTSPGVKEVTVSVSDGQDESSGTVVLSVKPVRK